MTHEILKLHNVMEHCDFSIVFFFNINSSNEILHSSQYFVRIVVIHTSLVVTPKRLGRVDAYDV